MSQDVLKNRLEELFTSPPGPPPAGPRALDGKPAPESPYRGPAPDAPKPALSPALSVVEGAVEREAEGAVDSVQQARERVYRALNRVSQTLSRLAAQSEILELLYTAAGEVLDNHNFSIALYDEASRFLSFPICTIDGERREVSRRPMGNGLAEYVIRTCAPLLLSSDVQPELRKRGIDVIGRPARSLLSVPMLAGDKVIGAVSLQEDEHAGVYTMEHLELLTLLASQAANALETTRLFEETRAALADMSESRSAEAQAARRALQLQAAAEVSRAASSILNPDELLGRVVDLIRDAFDLYYVGIFLVDLDGQYAVLRAGSGEAGRLMLERGHRLAIADSSMIGWCVAHCEPRVAHDVGGETVRFDNPLLPETRSELALPLAARGRVLGAMSVQSRHASAFSEQDIWVLQTMTDQVANAIANAQLFEQESRRSRELSVLNEMGRTLASVLEVDAVYELIYEYTARLMDAFNFFIALYDEDDGQISFPIVVNDNRRISVPSRPLRSGLTDYVLRHRQALLLSDDVPAHMEKLGIDFLALGNATPALSWLGVPMNYGDRILGAIVVQSVTLPALYREHDRDVLTSIASQSAIALENSRLFEQTRRQLDHLTTIQQSLSALTATYTREEMIDALLPHVAGAVRADTVSMFLIERPILSPALSAVEGGVEGEHLVRVGRYPLDDGGSAGLGQVIALADYPLTRQVLETRRPLAFTADDPALQEHARQAFREAGITASATVPLVGREGVLGTLAVSLRQPERAFSQDDLGLLQTLADQATVALEKVQYLEETRHLAQHRQLINQVTGKIRSAITVDEVLRIAVDELRQAAHATRAVARLNPIAPAHGNGETDPLPPPPPFHREGQGWGAPGGDAEQETTP